jgi:hypothetical protein
MKKKFYKTVPCDCNECKSSRSIGGNSGTKKIEVKPHSCFENSRVTKCDGGAKDERTCNICGKVWECSCNFDDDFD